MGLMKKIRGEFIDIVEWLDSSQNTLVHRFERHDNEIKYGAQLTVRESQKAVFVNEGKIADVFEPGMYKLETQNVPILSTLKGWKYGFNSPFKAETYFVSTKQFTDLKWGTKNPIMMRDKDFGMVRVRAFGNYAFRCSDPAKLIRQVAGTDGKFEIEEITNQLRDIILTRFSDYVAESKIPVLDLAMNYDEFSAALQEKLKPEFEEYGIEVTKYLIENISLPKAVEEAIDKRSSMGAVGDLNAYTQFQTAQSLEAAAKNPGGTASAGIGMGMGFAMANQMGGAMYNPNQNQNQQGGQQQQGGGAPPPPPVPGDIQFFVAVNGEQQGPYNKQVLTKMVQEKQLTKEMLVWKQGMANWTKAGEVIELNDVFNSVPPPPPPAPPAP
jgi:membrane protease subunit (stomatin/prohibitin family)